MLPLPQQWEGAQKRRNNSNLAGWKGGKCFPRKLPGDGVTRQGKEGGVTVATGRRGLEHSSRFRPEKCEGPKTEKRLLILHSRVNS